MTRKSKLLLLLLVLAPSTILTGCSTYSLQPLAGPNDPHVVYDPALEGKWKIPDQDCLLIISGNSQDKAYELEYSAAPDRPDACREEQNQPGLDDAGPFAGRLVELGDSRFLDVVPSYEPRKSLARFGYIPVHEIMKVQTAPQLLSLGAPDAQSLCEDTALNQLGICTADFFDDDFVFTASTELLQDFMAKHANDDKVFPKSDSDQDLQLVGRPESTPHLDFAERSQGWGGYSLNPLVEADDKNLIYDPALEGKWKHPDRDDYCLLVISGNAKDRSYSLEFFEARKGSGGCGEKWSEHGVNEAGPFSARLVQLGGDRFLDVFPVSEGPKLGGSPTLGYLPVHSILRVSVERGTLWLTEARDSCMEAGAEKPTIRTCKGYHSGAGDPRGEFVLTASTDVLQNFISKHARDGVVFPKDNQGDFRLQVGKPGTQK